MASASESKKAVFTHGSTMRHVVVMSSTGAVGLIAIFVVDVINLFYISLLGQQELAAAVGYASTIMFFMISLNIGFSIATSAVTAKALGAGDEKNAQKIAGSSLYFMVAMGLVSTLILFPLLGPIISLLGAKGETHQLTLEFMQIAILSSPMLSAGMAFASLLRAKGDAKRAMYVTLSGGATAMVLDPIFILWLDLGIHGAAIAILFTRTVIFFVGFHGAIIVHKLIVKPDIAAIKNVMHPFFVIAVPAVLTQIATPIGNAYVTAAISEFGDDAVAGWAIVGRLLPLAFAAIFSLSGAVGPILSQNLGAGNYDRVRMTLRDSLIFAFVYCLGVWLLLAVFSSQIVLLFSAEGHAADLILFFCLYVAGSFIFTGFLFVANAAFNNLGFPVYSTVFNWGRATIGIIPFVWVGQQWGPEGILAGWGLGAILFGIGSVWVCLTSIKNLAEKGAIPEQAAENIPTANSPFTSGRGSMLP